MDGFTGIGDDQILELVAVMAAQEVEIEAVADEGRAGTALGQFLGRRALIHRYMDGSWQRERDFHAFADAVVEELMG